MFATRVSIYTSQHFFIELPMNKINFCAVNLQKSNLLLVICVTDVTIIYTKYSKWESDIDSCIWEFIRRKKWHPRLLEVLNNLKNTFPRNIGPTNEDPIWISVFCLSTYQWFCSSSRRSIFKLSHILRPLECFRYCQPLQPRVKTPLRKQFIHTWCFTNVQSWPPRMVLVQLTSLYQLNTPWIFIGNCVGSSFLSPVYWDEKAGLWSL